MTSEHPKQKEPVIISSEADQIACNGGGGALGHPQVFYSFDGKSSVTCGYCGQVFVKEK